MKCFYHSADLDGHCSGAIVNLYYPECELIGINYGDVFPWETIKDGETVFMVDFSLQPFDDMERLDNISKLTWIDHHESAIKEAQQRGFLAKEQVLEIGRGACELVWEFLFPGVKNKAVRLLGRYDVWDLKPGTLELQNGLRMYNTLPTNNELWLKLFTGSEAFLNKVLKNGELLLKKKKMDTR